MSEDHRRPTWWEEQEAHRHDPFAHSELVGRLDQEQAPIREDRENRLRMLERRQWWLFGIGALLVFEIPLVVGLATYFRVH